MHHAFYNHPNIQKCEKNQAVRVRWVLKSPPRGGNLPGAVLRVPFSWALKPVGTQSVQTAGLQLLSMQGSEVRISAAQAAITNAKSWVYYHQACMLTIPESGSLRPRPLSAAAVGRQGLQELGRKLRFRQRKETRRGFPEEKLLESAA